MTAKPLRLGLLLLLPALVLAAVLVPTVARAPVAAPVPTAAVPPAILPGADPPAPAISARRLPPPPGKIEACTAFALTAPDGTAWAGKNLDWEVGDGIVAVNEQGVEKTAWHPETTSTFSWVSRFGSVTFNQFGLGFPLGGINEAGLVVEELSYSPTRYPRPDARADLNEFQWVQFQLDNFSTVAEVLSSDTLVRIQPFLFGLHYLVADASGAVAVIEFLEGERVVYSGNDLPVPVLTNDTYANSVRYLDHHVGFGGTQVVSDGPESPERFVSAATLLKAYGEGKPVGGLDPPDPLSHPQSHPREFAFHILDSVRQSDTQWTIVYDLGGREVSFKTRDLPSARSLAVDTLDFSCRSEDMVLPLSADLQSRFARARPPGESLGLWTPEQNRLLLASVFSKLESFLSSDELPPSTAFEKLAEYPSTVRCVRDP